MRVRLPLRLQKVNVERSAAPDETCRVASTLVLKCTLPVYQEKHTISILTEQRTSMHVYTYYIL